MELTVRFDELQPGDLIVHCRFSSPAVTSTSWGTVLNWFIVSKSKARGVKRISVMWTAAGATHFDEYHIGEHDEFMVSRA